MSWIDKDELQRLRESVNLVEFVGEQVERRHLGTRWFGLCPFHDEKTPSFSVDSERGLFHCFGCGAGGDVFRFVQLVERVSFLQAIALIRQRTGFAGSPARDHPTWRLELKSIGRPPLNEVNRLWEDCRVVTADADVVAWLASRRIDADRVADRDIARALPLGSAVPPWARCRGRLWPASGHRVVLGLFDEHGLLASLHARNLRPGVQPKGASPADFAMRGLVLADSGGRLMLEKGSLAGVLWLAEGAPDFLVTATAWGDAADPAPAILGVIAGSWSAAIAERVPDGARVVIAVHHDDAGKHYLERIVETLSNRVVLERWTPPEVRAAP